VCSGGKVVRGAARLRLRRRWRRRRGGGAWWNIRTQKYVVESASRSLIAVIARRLRYASLIRQALLRELYGASTYAQLLAEKKVMSVDY